MTTTNLDIKTGNVFRLNWISKKKIVINRGGTRAGKTYSIMQQLALWLITGEIRNGQKIEKGTASVVRKTFPSLRATAKRDFEEIIDNWDIRRLLTERKSENYFEYKGRRLEFFSVDDQQKVRGRKRQILFCNEGNELNYDSDFFQLLIRTTDLVIIDLNPSDPYNWIKEELEDKRQHDRADVDVLVTTYKDNPFLPDSLIREIEGIKDEQLRKVYVYGEYGIVKGLVFPNITIVDQMPIELKKRAIGLDFGYTNDPTCAVECGTIGDNLYIDELFYEYALDNNQIAKRLDKQIEVYCDSAEPKSIAELRKNGIRAMPAKKGKDSIDFGIQILKQYNLFITARSLNALREQKKYKYKIDHNGRALNKPIDDFNHFWDAVRYYALSKLADPQGIITSRKRKRR